MHVAGTDSTGASTSTSIHITRAMLQVPVQVQTDTRLMASFPG